MKVTNNLTRDIRLPHWLEYCKSCGQRHRLRLKCCPTCKCHDTPQPVSCRVTASCHADYRCDGCIALAHRNPYGGGHG